MAGRDVRIATLFPLRGCATPGKQRALIATADYAPSLRYPWRVASALIVPNPDAFARVAQSLHLDPANEETCCDENLRSVFMQHVQQCTAAFPGYAQVRELAVVNEPWTPDNGMATPTLKLRRKQILQHYSDLAERMYAGH
jgi:long-subunit acyl-CoA synthetase (AMP-forming)